MVKELDIKELIIPAMYFVGLVALAGTIGVWIALRGFSMSEARQQIAELSKPVVCDEIKANSEEASDCTLEASSSPEHEQPYLPDEENPALGDLLTFNRSCSEFMSNPGYMSTLKAEDQLMAASSGLTHPLNASAEENDLGAQVMRKRINEELYPAFQHLSGLSIPSNPAAVDKSVSL